MPADVEGHPSPSKTTRTTRSSIRQSLNFASVGKALADVMNKDGKDPDNRRGANKAKETPSRRISAAGPKGGEQAATPSALPKPSSRNITSPDSKTITRTARTASISSKIPATVVDELGVRVTDADTPQASATLTRTSSVLRPRNTPTGSALPKYRPKSTSVDLSSKTPLSPVRAGTRRKHTSSEEERDAKGDGGSTSDLTLDVQSPAERASRPISPIPRRASTKFTLSTRSNTSPPSDLSKERGQLRGSSGTSATPPRPTKTSKPSLSPSNKANAASRPPSTSSSQPPVRGPSTPTPMGGASTRGKSSQRRTSMQKITPCSTPVPLNSTNRKPEKLTSSSTSPSTSTEGADTEDSLEADDVEFMLAACASPTAPTPALPRIRTKAHSQLREPQTPSRLSNVPPSRGNMSYLLPIPQNDGSPEQASRHAGDNNGPLPSWEQLAADMSSVLEAPEPGNMISEIPAPFFSTPGLVSPSPSLMQLGKDDPVSPSPYQLPSPGAFTSISQILLPNVTPSPAVHHNQDFDQVSSEIPAIDAAMVTLLRLQLASAENLAKERLDQVQSLEGQLHAMKVSRMKQEEELTLQVSELEQKMHESLNTRDRTNDIALVRELEEKLKSTEVFREQAVEEAVARAEEESLAQQEKLLREADRSRQLSCVVREVSAQWNEVRDLAGGELELVKSYRDTLVVLLADLESCQTQLI